MICLRAAAHPVIQAAPARRRRLSSAHFLCDPSAHISFKRYIYIYRTEETAALRARNNKRGEAVNNIDCIPLKIIWSTRCTRRNFACVTTSHCAQFDLTAHRQKKKNMMAPARSPRKTNDLCAIYEYIRKKIYIHNRNYYSVPHKLRARVRIFARPRLGIFSCCDSRGPGSGTSRRHHIFICICTGKTAYLVWSART